VQKQPPWTSKGVFGRVLVAILGSVDGRLRICGGDGLIALAGFYWVFIRGRWDCSPPGRGDVSPYYYLQVRFFLH